MSRYSDADEDMTEGGYGMWAANVRRAAKGRRGQKFLRELLTTLEALPQKRLLANIFYDPTTNEACLLGAHCARTGTLPEGDWLDDLNEGSDSDTADYVSGTFDVARVLAWDLAYHNDEIWGGRWSESDSAEKRYEDAVKWIRTRLKEPEGVHP